MLLGRSLKRKAANVCSCLKLRHCTTMLKSQYHVNNISGTESFGKVNTATVTVIHCFEKAFH